MRMYQKRIVVECWIRGMEKMEASYLLSNDKIRKRKEQNVQILSDSEKSCKAKKRFDF